MKIINETKKITKFKKFKNVIKIKYEMYQNDFENINYKSNDISKMNIEKNEKNENM